MAANTVFNGSFELGTDGFALVRELRLATNPSLKFTPLKLSAGAPGAGKNSLMIENPYAECFDLFSREFKLKPATTYRFTAKLKAEKGGETLRISVFKVDDKWLVYSRMFNFAGGEWQNFDFTFTTEKREGNGWHHIQIASATHDGKIADTFYIDDLKIEEIGTCLRACG